MLLKEQSQHPKDSLLTWKTFNTNKLNEQENSIIHCLFILEEISSILHELFLIYLEALVKPAV